ncbi:enoyl-CoA hydratase-related protein [Rheinheimera sp. 1928-s]|uniref:enoyl-CoA hydratase-related protein n=1 Tax=Rheinheimera sp. 1928-s TaxID=3033803 RepID=UPI0026291E8D|nr:enoyl-CoA hydratase-related protein [Rheinheimera sp. 1928-s]MDF3124479.1 enoyl-CoA hydratase-related protein [Rheinheimera sp. 1928-s]
MSSFTIEKQGHVAVLQLTAAEKRNLLTPEIALQIAAAVHQLSLDPELKVLCVIGTERAFCAGADLAVLQHAVDGDGSELKQLYQAFSQVADCPLLTIALVNGPAVGAGMNLAMVCDIRLASKDAWFDSRFFQLALHPGGGHGWLLPQLIGWQQAMAMLFCGEKLNAEQAWQYGLVKEVLAADQLLPRALTMTADLATVPTELVRQTKSSMRQLLQCKEHSQAVEFEYQQQFYSLQQDAARQAIAALQHKLATKS